MYLARQMSSGFNAYVITGDLLELVGCPLTHYVLVFTPVRSCVPFSLTPPLSASFSGPQNAWENDRPTKAVPGEQWPLGRPAQMH